jgi:hypothetical protein
MNQEIKQRWIKALRSGEYKQGYGNLYHCGKFCCLGVLTDLYIKEHGLQWERDSADLWSFEGNGGTLHESVQRWAGIPNELPVIRGKSAVVCNDNYKFSFDEIANLIEKDKEL